MLEFFDTRHYKDFKMRTGVRPTAELTPTRLQSLFSKLKIFGEQIPSEVSVAAAKRMERRKICYLQETYRVTGV